MLLAAKYLRVPPGREVEVVKEVELHQRASGCPNIVQFAEAIETDTNLVIIMEL